MVSRKLQYHGLACRWLDRQVSDAENFANIIDVIAGDGDAAVDMCSK